MFWERFIDLGLLGWALGVGLILGVVWGPKEGQPHRGRDGGGGAFLSYSCGRSVVVCVSHVPPPQAGVVSFGFHCVDSA